jgi:hypothetical protein
MARQLQFAERIAVREGFGQHVGEGCLAWVHVELGREEEVVRGGVVALEVSRGSVHIASGKSEDKPIYDPNLLSHPLDLEIMARQMEM